MSDSDTSDSEHERGGPLECGKCRVGLVWDPVDEKYGCPECGWRYQDTGTDRSTTQQDKNG